MFRFGRFLYLLLWGAVSVGLTLSAHAGAKLDIDGESSIDLGFMVQSLAIATEKDRDGDGRFDSDNQFKVRRARLRLTAMLNEWVSTLIQSELGSTEGGSGQDARIIDAYVLLKPHTLAQIYAGIHMAPANRQNMTAAGSLLTMDRPGVIYKALTWGTRSLSAFANVNYADSDAGLRGDVDVRDTGVTLFGTHSLNSRLHYKYYGGVYNGVQLAGRDEFRYTGRFQVNFLDAEPGYYNESSYQGRKETIGLGVSLDRQDAVAGSLDRGVVDYRFYSLDVFTEFKMGDGSLSLEAAWLKLDLDGAMMLDHDRDPLTATRDARRAEGDGYYIQAAYTLNAWQPWAGFEQFSSESPSDHGSYDAYRLGVTYYIKGRNANVKAGFEKFETKAPIGSTLETTIDTFTVGLFVSY